jgi:lipoprotein-anchoring transpeptidase ErfK/SrfK
MKGLIGILYTCTALALAGANPLYSKDSKDSLNYSGQQKKEPIQQTLVLDPKTQRPLISPIYFSVYSKLCDAQKEINRSRKKTKDYWLFVKRRDELKAKTKKLDEIALTHQFRIEIIKKDFILNLYENDVLIKSYPAAIGRLNKKKESKTISGTYNVIEKYDIAWFKKIKKYKKVGSLLLDSKEGIAIHGTTESESIGKAASSGCIRIKPNEALELQALIPKGTNVEIR